MVYPKPNSFKIEIKQSLINLSLLLLLSCMHVGLKNSFFIIIIGIKPLISYLIENRPLKNNKAT
jgi:hypothetical protein